MHSLLVEDEKKVADFVPRGLQAERFATDVASRFEYDIILGLMLPG